MSKEVILLIPTNITTETNYSIITEAQIAEQALTIISNKQESFAINPPDHTNVSAIVSLPKKSYKDPIKYQDHILEQYKLYIASIEQNTSRRNIANSFFLTLHIVTITAAATFYKNGINEIQIWMLIPFLVLISSCYFWYRVVESYKQLNSVKFKVVEEIEKHLPLAIWVKSEWKFLGFGKDPNLYIPITHIERLVPILMTIGYSVLSTMVILPKYITYKYLNIVLLASTALIFAIFLVRVYVKEHRKKKKA